MWGRNGSVKKALRETHALAAMLTHTWHAVLYGESWIDDVGLRPETLKAPSAAGVQAEVVFSVASGETEAGLAQCSTSATATVASTGLAARLPTWMQCDLAITVVAPTLQEAGCADACLHCLLFKVPVPRRQQRPVSAYLPCSCQGLSSTVAVNVS